MANGRHIFLGWDRTEVLPSRYHKECKKPKPSGTTRARGTRCWTTRCSSCAFVVLFFSLSRNRNKKSFCLSRTISYVQSCSFQKNWTELKDITGQAAWTKKMPSSTLVVFFFFLFGWLNSFRRKPFGTQRFRSKPWFTRLFEQATVVLKTSTYPGAEVCDWIWCK